MFKKECNYCGVLYNTRYKESKYCSAKCSQLDRKNGEVKICPVCNKEFYTSASLQDKKYCSYKCKSIVQKETNQIIIYSDRAEIKIETKKYGTKFAIIDLDDVEKVRPYKWWTLTNNGIYFYVQAAKSRKEKINLHRFVMNCPSDMCVHHINHNPLDNRKENLEICTLSDNCQDKKTTKAITGYQNIHPYRNGYRVKITRYGKDIIRRVKTLQEAIEIRNQILSKM